MRVRVLLRVLLCVNSREFKRDVRKRERSILLGQNSNVFFPAVKRDLFLLRLTETKGKRKGKEREKETRYFATLLKNVEKTKKCAGELIFEEEEEAIFFLFKIRL